MRNKSVYRYVLAIQISLAALIGLAGCSLAADVTPPPDYQTSTPVPAVTSSAEETPVLPEFCDIDGTVSLGENGSLPSEMTVSLHGYDSMSETITQTAEVGTDGSYHFSQVAMATGRVFMVSTEYKGTTFTSDMAYADDASPVITLPIVVFDPTTDTSSLSASRWHVIFDFSTQGSVTVEELFIISNSSNQVVTAPTDGGPILTFDLPEGASDLQIMDYSTGNRFIETENGFGDTGSIAPGENQQQVMYSYSLPYEDGLSLSLPVPLPVDNVIVMLPEGSITASGAQITAGDLKDVQGAQYRLYNGTNLSKGETLSLTLAGKAPAATQTISGIKTEWIFGMAFFGVALVFSGMWLFYLWKKSQKSAIPAAPAAEVEVSDADTLIEAIVTLDDQFHAGKLTETAYNKRRAELKASLEKIIK